jgi:type IV fimbrial biogenesis protein FimT
MNMNSTKNLNHQQRGTQRGVSMIEACIVVAIAGILAGSALPSFKETLDKRQVEGVSSEVGTDLRYARSEAVARNAGVRVSFFQGCYVVHTGDRADCQCSGDAPAVCTCNAVALKTVSTASGHGVRVVSNVSSMRFDPAHGTTSPTGTVCTVPTSGRAVHHVVSIMGRVRTCSPATAGAPCAPC